MSGTVFTIGPDRVQSIWPNARVTLKNLKTTIETATISNEFGVYVFTGVLQGDYEVTVTLAGFAPLTKRITLDATKPAKLDFQMVPQGQTETVKVSAQNSGVDLSSSSGNTPELNADILKSVVRVNQDFQDALPLLPGVVRGFDGLIRIKGGRTNQANTLVNSASVTDPFTGQAALSLPVVAVQSVRVLSNPFSSEYGRFASGVVDLSTRGGTDEWKWLFEDPIPRFRWIDGHTHGVESASPHLTFAGPLKKDRAFIFQSLGYGYDTVTVPSLPNPNNVRIVEKVNTYTQLDWLPSPSHRFTAVLAFDPQNTDYANINTFNPEPVTANNRLRDYFLSITHRWILANGGFVQSLFSAKELNSKVYPATYTGQMFLSPPQNSGSYFEQQQRDTPLYQWSQAFHVRPLEHAGKHLFTVGYSYAHSSYDGSVENIPVQVFRQDNTLSSRIDFVPSPHSQIGSNEFAFFVQDNLQVNRALTFDIGLRLDSDSLSSEAVNIAPRIGFVFSPSRSNTTAIRGGFGVFFDKIPLNVAAFKNFPAQTITTYASDGKTVISGPATFPHVIANENDALRVPYSLGWTLQLDHEFRRNVFVRFGYEDRRVYREFYVNPVQTSNDTAELLLMNSGHQSYREFLTMLRWRVNERSTVFASYVHSNAQGELNDYNRFFGNFPYPLIRSEPIWAAVVRCTQSRLILGCDRAPI